MRIATVLCALFCLLVGVQLLMAGGDDSRELTEGRNQPQQPDDATPRDGSKAAPASQTTPPSLTELKREGARRSNFRSKTVQPSGTAAPKPDLAAFRDEVQPILKRVCVQCHGAETQEGNIRIDDLDPDLQQGEDVDWWLEILAVVSNDEMPPPDEAELTDIERTKVVDWLSNEIQVASSVRRANGGHSSFRRMTRYEYNYALQDILGLPWNFAKDLPPEANSEDGFQNSSETLHMSLMQLETYRRLARQALKRATVQGERPPVLYWGVNMTDASRFEWPKQVEQLNKIKEQFKDDPVKLQQRIEQLDAQLNQPHSGTFYRNRRTGRTARASWAYYGAKYAFKPFAHHPEQPTAFDHAAILPGGRHHNLIVELGNRVPDEGIMRVRVRASRSPDAESHPPSMQLEFGWRASNEGRAVIRVSSEDTPVEADPDEPQIYQWDVPLGEIYPRNSVRNTSQLGQTPSPSEYIRLVNSSVEKADIQVEYVEVAAPVYDQWPPASHQRIFFDSEHRTDEPAYAREVLSSFMSRAWRRTITEDELTRKLKLFDAIRDQCDTFEDAMVEVLATVLSSPSFLYVTRDSAAKVSTATDSATRDSRDTDPPATPTTPATERLSPGELATRLSMFLWSSVPDAQLMTLAREDQLSDPEILASEVKRMLDDPRSERLSEHFVYQWLNLQLLEFQSLQQQSQKLDPLLKEAMQHEPIALFKEVLKNDESVLDFIHADYTMANERLAKHYGLPGVHGNHFRRVSLESDRRRGGVLTQAGLLAMNSDGADSHPLKRGIWLLESLLNDPPPPPPPAVPEIDLANPEIAKMTLKQRIEDHRNHAACMTCHSKIDPWGIAFENYDALGRWREQINGKPIDASSLLFNKQKLDGMDGLKRFLLANRQDQFVRAMVYKMTTYALGRPLTFADRSGIDRMTVDVRQQGDGLATLIKVVATSELFQSR